MEITKPRGTEDLFFNLDPSFDIVTSIAKMVAQLNGFYEVKTPIFEHEELFIRSIGAASDIVNKEFYQFKDKSDRNLVLRPEQTASIIRAVVENKLLNKTVSPIKLFYCGPMFRYERPQSGRLRQFHQFGVECINSTSYCDDVEMLVFAKSIIDAFELKKYIININNICGFETRKKWIDALKRYFAPFKNLLTEDSQKRLDINPLRILDDKIDGQKDFVLKAPKISSFASKDELDYFSNITKLLDVMKIDYKINETLVRGLDYYCNFVFEISSTSDVLKGQPTLIGGGRYNNLMKELGGEDASCVGFAMGIERIIIALENDNLLDNAKQKYIDCDVTIANLSKESELIALILSRLLRLAGISCSSSYNTYKLDKHFKFAASCHAKFVLILGPKELKAEKIIVKNQKTLKQQEVAMPDLIKYILENKEK